jgi:polysaccharide export outer membrane protein
MMRTIFSRVVYLSFLFLFNSCNSLVPSVMFKQKDYQYFELAQKKLEEYVIVSGDLLSLQIFSRDGFKLLDMIVTEESKLVQGATEVRRTYLVDEEGFVNFPIIGELFVRGYTETQLKTILAEKLSNLYIDPYVIVRVENRRAIVFKAAALSLGVGGAGAAGGATIVNLNASPTSIIEVIAKAGGLAPSSRSNKIKVIRGDLKNPQVIEVNLSTIEGVRKSAMDVMPNDIIYIDTRKNIARNILSDVSPFIALTTSVTSLIFIIRSLGKF